MNNKKTIVHIIQNLGRGGAETLLVSVLKRLKDYNNIVVTLDSLNEFEEKPECDHFYCLNLQSNYLFWTAIPGLRRIIRKHDADIVHSHLYFSTLLARIACPSKVGLVSTIHASVSETLEYKKWIIRLGEKWTYKWRSGIIVGVSENTLNDYFSNLHLPRRKNFVLYNFIDVKPAAAEQVKRPQDGTFRMLSVGSLKLQKNQQFLLKAMTKLKEMPVTLDIYGSGALADELNNYIKENDIAVRLMGLTDDVTGVMKEYDAFVLSSLFEGFSLAVLEAMEMNKPMLLPDIETFREQCADTAAYFSLDNYDDFVRQVELLKNDPLHGQTLAIRAKQRIMSRFMPQHHIEGLRAIYKEALQMQ